MKLNHKINHIFNTGVFIDQPDWSKSILLKEWWEVNKTITDIINIDSKDRIETREIFKEDIEVFSTLMRKTIKDYKFLSKIQKWISFIIRSPKYYNSLRLRKDSIAISAQNEEWKIIGGIEAKIKINPHDEKYAYICWLVVDPYFKWRKIGVILLKKLEELLLQQWINYTVSAIHNENNASINVHEKYGARKLSDYYNFYFFSKELKKEK